MTHNLLAIFSSISVILLMLTSTAYADDLAIDNGGIEICSPTPTVTASSITETTVVLKWTFASYCFDSELVQRTHYIVRLNDGETISTEDLALHVYELEPNTQYTFSVVAIFIDQNNQAGYVTFTTGEIPEIIEIEEKKSGGGCSGDCTPPTFGVLPTGEQFVDVGFEFGDLEFIIDKYHVEVPLINANVGEEYIIKAKVFEANGPVAHYGIAFGVGDIPVPIYSAGSSFIDLDRLIFKEYSEVPVYEVTQIDPSNLVNLVSITTGSEVCNDTTEQLCQIFELVVSFNQRLVEEKLMIQAWDDSRNLVQNLLNDGLDVSGISLNAPPTYTVSDKYERGIHKVITISDRTLEDLTIATDESEIQWNLINGFWVRDSPPQVIADTDPNSRNSLVFKDKIIYEQIRASYTSIKLGY